MTRDVIITPLRRAHTGSYNIKLTTTIINLVSANYILNYKETRLPSNLRPTACECVHLVTHGHFRSRHNCGGHIIRSAIAENPKEPISRYEVLRESHKSTRDLDSDSTSQLRLLPPTAAYRLFGKPHDARKSRSDRKLRE